MSDKNLSRRSVLRGAAVAGGLATVPAAVAGSVVSPSSRIRATVHYDDYEQFDRSILYPGMSDTDNCTTQLFPALMSHGDDVVVNGMLDCDGDGTFDWFRCDPYRRDRDEGWIERTWLEFEDEIP